VAVLRLDPTAYRPKRVFRLGWHRMCCDTPFVMSGGNIILQKVPGHATLAMTMNHAHLQEAVTLAQLAITRVL